MNREDRKWLARTIAKRIYAARRANKLIQEALASKVGVRPTSISQFENGHRIPTTPNLYALARGLHVRADWLLGLSETPVERRVQTHE